MARNTGKRWQVWLAVFIGAAVLAAVFYAKFWIWSACHPDAAWWLFLLDGGR